MQDIQEHTMRYIPTCDINDQNERKKTIAEDILREYPNLGELAYSAAELEKPFGRIYSYDFNVYDIHHEEIKINRLIDIIIVTEEKPEFSNEYKKALEDLKNSYRKWMSLYMEHPPKDSEAYIVMSRLKEHLLNKDIPLLTFAQASEERERIKKEIEAKEQYIKDHTMKYAPTLGITNPEERMKKVAEDILREYPNLGELAYKAAELEDTFEYIYNVHEDYRDIRVEEIKINRLIDIIIVTEGKPEFLNEYKKAIEDLKKAYDKWKSLYGYANPEQQEAYIVMSRLKEHLLNKDIPLLTFAQASEERERKYK